MRGPFILFTVLVAVSHILLPALDRGNLGPFSNWSLFSEVWDGPFNDPIISARTHRFMLSWPMTKKFWDGITLWNLAGLGLRTEDHSRFIHEVERLGLKVEKMCPVFGAQLVRHMQMTPQERMTACERLSE